MKILKRIALLIVALVVVIYASVWALSPVVTRHFVGAALAQHHLIIDSDSQVRVNLFWSRISVSNLYLHQGANKTYALDTLQIDYSIWHLLAKEVRINRIALKGMSLLVVKRGDDLNVAGINLSDKSGEVPENSSETNASDPKDAPSGLLNTLRFSVPDIVLENIEITAINDKNEHKIFLEKLMISNSVYHQKKLESRISLQASIDEIGIEFKSKVDANNNSVNADLSLDIDNAQLTSIAYLLPENIKELNAIGKINVASKINFEEGRLTLGDTNIGANLANFRYLDEKVDVSLATTEVSAFDISAIFAVDGNIEMLDGNLVLALQQLDVSLADKNQKLLVLDSFASGDITLEGRDSIVNIAAPQLVFEKLGFSRVGENEPFLFSTEFIRLSNLLVSPKEISLALLELGESHSNVIFSENGELETFVNLAALSSNVETNASGETETASINQPNGTSIDETIASTDENATPIIKLGEFKLASPFNIAIEDKRNSYAFTKQFDITELQVENIDSSLPEQQSDFTIKVKDQEYFTSDISGWVKPFTEKVNLNVGGKLREFPLQEVAPYLRDSLGFEVGSGQMDTDFSAKVVNDKLDSKINVFLRGANFISSQQANDESNLIGQTAVPLNVAMNMLKDSDGNIKLKLPVDGDINDPNFSVRHVVGLVVKRVALKQAKNQLMIMFVPYAQVVSVALVAGEAALKIRLEDLLYSPRQIAPEQAQETFILQMTALLKDKPDLRVNICPVATAEDIQLPNDTVLTAEQHYALLNLAKQRGKAFKAHLVEVGGIDSARLLLCSPEVDTGKKAKPKLGFKT